jgi:hypothetical protein
MRRSAADRRTRCLAEATLADPSGGHYGCQAADSARLSSDRVADGLAFIHGRGLRCAALLLARTRRYLGGLTAARGPRPRTQDTTSRVRRLQRIEMLSAPRLGPEGKMRAHPCRRRLSLQPVPARPAAWNARLHVEHEVLYGAPPLATGSPLAVMWRIPIVLMRLLTLWRIQPDLSERRPCFGKDAPEQDRSG